MKGLKKQDGSSKNDCEYNAFVRLIANLRKAHPKLKIVICGDALYAKGKVVDILRENGMSYILNVKKDGNKKFFGYLREKEWNNSMCNYFSEKKIIGQKVKKSLIMSYRYEK